MYKNPKDLTSSEILLLFPTSSGECHQSHTGFVRVIRPTNDQFVRVGPQPLRIGMSGIVAK